MTQAWSIARAMKRAVLIADDHPLFRDALKLAVAQAVPGAQIIEADTVHSLFAALDAHRNWVENVQCLRQMQLKADEGLIEADNAFASALESASDFSALFNSQLAFMNQQLAMQNLIWQGLVKMSARGPTVWAEQYLAAQKA